jgi:hypothetical protein
MENARCALRPGVPVRAIASTFCPIGVGAQAG